MNARTVVLHVPDQAPGEPAEPYPLRRARTWYAWLRAWAHQHRVTLRVLGVVLFLVAAVTAWNLQGWPGRVDDDEGTYVAEAWAMLYPHHLAQYTYWYDHPPLGWAQLAAFIWLTDGFARVPSSVMAGREFMWLITVASSVLLWVLARRLGFRRPAAAVTVLAFGLSPLAVYYHRMVSLDNIGTLWLLAAMVAATSRRRTLGAAFWAAVWTAAAVLSKETLLILLPAVAWLIWQRTERRTAKWHLGVFAATFALFTAFYPLLAALRGELFPGSGHVSLAWAVWWQLAGRTGSGSVFDATSQAHGLLTLWLGTDSWLLLAGLALIPAGLVIRRLRPIAFGLLIEAADLLAGGYLPYFYVTALLPFAALLIGGTADTLWGPAPLRWVQSLGQLAVLSATLTTLIVVLPQWGTRLADQASYNGAASSLAATAWVAQHVPHDAVIAVDDYLWLDLKRAGMNPVWIQKTNPDAQTTQSPLPEGWQSIQYVVVTDKITAGIGQLPVLQAALKHSILIKSFGDGVALREVVTAPLPLCVYFSAARHSGALSCPDISQHIGRLSLAISTNV